MSILPKRRRLAFVLELYDNGICRGSCFFSTSVKEFQVSHNEQVLSEDLFAAPILDVKLQGGPQPTKSLAYPEWRIREDQKQAFLAMEEQYRERMHLYAEIQRHAASYVEAQRIIPVPDRELRIATLKFYDEEMEDRLITKIFKYQEFQRMLREQVALLGELVERFPLDDDVPLEPGFTNVRMGSEILRIPAGQLEVVERFHREEVLPAEADELEFRRKVKTLGFLWTEGKDSRLRNSIWASACLGEDFPEVPEGSSARYGQVSGTPKSHF